MMSLQQTRSQMISQTQSTAVVQTLLRAGLGCVTFLRNLLPDDNFSESYFTTNGDSTPQSSQTSSSPSIGGSQQRTSGFKIMTMARGYSEEADRILNYLEHGIFDALGKQYLRSFIFGIYLDSKDPNNIVEAYTFNFRYHKLPGTESVIPILTLGEGLGRSNREDPVTEATKQGRVPTLRDVKKSVKTLLKTLIHAMSQMDVLPKRRYVTFKIFYTDSTPSDYEPPYFQAGDSEKDRWYMMTHDIDEVPDKWSVGKVETGHHTVNLNISSIVTYLPSVEHQEAVFSGTTDSHSVIPTLTPMQEAAIRAQQIEQQEKDADLRNLVWPAEADLDMDAEGEDDPDYTRQSDGSFLRVSDSHILVPVGIRNETGIIEAIPNAKPTETVYGGGPEQVPIHLNDLNQSLTTTTQCDETQTFDFVASNPPVSPSVSSRAPTPTQKIPHKQESTISWGQDEDESQLLAKMSINDTVDPEEISQTVDDTSNLNLCKTRSKQFPPLRNGEKRQEPGPVVGLAVEDKGLACECGISAEDESCFCEGGCARWFHVWCMGYHSIRDKRLPTKFICFDCRLRADASWELIKLDLHPLLMSKYKDLTLFRRAIKVAERMNVLTPPNFAKQLGTNFSESRRMLKQLEDEGFIQELVVETDELGIAKTRPKKKSIPKQTKKRRNNIQKSQYHFNKATTKSLKYRNYFDPSLQVENKLLGIAEIVAKYKTRLTHLGNENQVPELSKPAVPDPLTASKPQKETNMAVDPQPQVVSSRSNKRPTIGDQEDALAKKKVKISVTTGVDLAE